jgi:hypothetical protein
MASAIRKAPSVQDAAKQLGQGNLNANKAFAKKRTAKAEARRKAEARSEANALQAQLQASQRRKLKARAQGFKGRIDVMA